MGNPRWLNLTVGIFVLSGILAFVWLAVSATGTNWQLFGQQPTVISANFSNIGSLKPKAPVVLSGVRVGKVSSIELERDNFMAVIRFEIESGYDIPDDSIASIQTAGLVGEQYISIEPGHSKKYLENNSHLSRTKAALGLEGVLEGFSGESIDNSDQLGRSYDVTANFSNIGSLKVNDPIMIAGVRVGSVSSIGLDEKSYSANVTLKLGDRFPIPKDSIVSIKSSSLLGGQFIAIDPGSSAEFVAEGDHLLLTKSAGGLDSLIETFGGGSIDNSEMNAEHVVVTAKFTNIGSLKVNAPVTISGVNVGRVSGISLDPLSFDAVVEMSLAKNMEIPKDTGASIYTQGLIGGQYIALDPGGSFDNLENGDELRLTQSAVIIERLIGQFLTSMGSKDKAEE